MYHAVRFAVIRQDAGEPKLMVVVCDFCLTVLVYHCCRSGRREIFSAKRRGGPAPGAYENPIQAFKELKPSRVAREVPPRWKNSAERGPAPNAYDVVGKTTDFKSVKVPSTMQFFGTTAVRSGIEDVIKNKRSIPAPGHYDGYRRAMAVSVRQGEPAMQERRPFNQSTARFPRQRHVGPGPAGYSRQSGVHDTVAGSGRRPIAPFGCSGVRNDTSTIKRVGPPPGMYDTTKHNAIGSSGAQLTGPFKSKAAMRPMIKTVGPSASAYDIRAAAGDIQSKPPPKNRDKLYVGTAERFKICGTTQYGRLPDSSIPAPNSYESAATLSKGRGGRMLDHSKFRFDSSEKFAPAPNSYQHSETLVKPSFNATFDRDSMYMYP